MVGISNNPGCEVPMVVDLLQLENFYEFTAPLRD